ncbi:hypothetical protein GF352_03505 [archaeon]|nr:hypothetical protein [archaeon]
MSVFKKYDIRGLLEEDFVYELGMRFAGKYGSPVVMTDPKKASKRLSRAFAKGVAEAGFNVTYCGVGPTDMCSVAGLVLQKPSVMFTASHLSDGQEGIKFHDSEGLPFSTEMIAELRSLKKPAEAGDGRIVERDFTSEYFNRLLTRYRELFNYDLRGFKVLVDLKNGCGLSHLLLKRLGAGVDVINTKGSDPGNGCLEMLKEKAGDYDLVLIHDFDADRVVVVNGEGIVHGSLIACLLTKVYSGRVVASIDTSQVLFDYAPVTSSKVGDPFVARAIIQHDACLGVEPSGHYTDPLFAPTSSGSLFAIILAGLAYKNNINELVSGLPPVVIESASLNVDDKASFMERVKQRVSGIISDVDGVKFDFNGGTALVRPSGTEPIIRFHLENPGNGGVEELVRRFR